MLKFLIFSVFLYSAFLCVQSQDVGVSIGSLTIPLLKNLTLTGNCSTDAECTDLCGSIKNGVGTCDENKNCQCSKCPTQTAVLLATVNRLCAYNPVCPCPDGTSVSLNTETGILRGGHVCITGNKTMCVCFCASDINVSHFLGCPVKYLGLF